MARRVKRSREKRVGTVERSRRRSQTRERRMYLYWLSLKHSRDFQHGYRKGWYDGPYMQVARQFKLPIREVKEIIEMQKQRGPNG